MFNIRPKKLVATAAGSSVWVGNQGVVDPNRISVASLMDRRWIVLVVTAVAIQSAQSADPFDTPDAIGEFFN
jgi:hypothetical protein